MPTYDGLVYLFASLFCAVVMAPKRASSVMVAVLALWVVYGSSADVAGLMLSFFAALFIGLLDTLRWEGA